MKGPERLLESNDPLVSSLMRSGLKPPGPGPGALDRTLGALGAGTALGSATGTAVGASAMVTKATTSAAVIIAQWAGIGIVSGVLVSLSAEHVLQPRAGPPSVASARSESASVRRASVKEPGLERSEPPSPRWVSAPSTVPRAPAAWGTVDSAGPQPLVGSAAVSAPAAPPSGALVEEIEQLERIRMRFGEHDMAGTTREINQYYARFPHGQLRPEVELIERRAGSRVP